MKPNPTQLRVSAIAALVSATVVLGACNTRQQDSGNAKAAQDAAIQRSVQSDMLLAETTTALAPAQIGRQAIGRVKTESMPIMPSVPSGEKYQDFDNNRTTLTQQQPVSTFSIDVDTGAYANVRRFLQNGQLPPADAVRVEELLNYFNYSYDTNATKEQPFSVMTELGPTPWNDNTHLLHIGLQGYKPADLDDRPANLTFLIDVSGSMNSSEKLGLLKTAMSLLVRELDEKDTVSMVVYAGSSGVALEPTAGNEHQTIEYALSQLQAGGSTHGEQGIELAYKLALENFDENGTNRVILATDGDFNVGTSDTESLVELIEQKRKAGIALTTLGFGMGNYNDHLMEQLADAGNGNYAYIDTLGEARKVLVDELDSTLVTIAKDVKIQVEFNPATVSEYRLIGYTNRLLNNEDFNDDKVDAGEIGAGHSVTALYEVALRGNGGERHTPRRYDNANTATNSDLSNELAQVRLRFKLPDEQDSTKISQIITRDSVSDSIEATSEDFRFSASVAAFGQLLRRDTHVGEFDFASTRQLVSLTASNDPFGYRSEYMRLVDLAQSLDSLQQAALTSGD